MGCILLDDAIVKSDLLSSTEKLVYGVILALSNSKGYCYASNEYIAKRVSLSKRTITKAIGELKKLNYIRVENIDYQRRIYLTHRV